MSAKRRVGQCDVRSSDQRVQKRRKPKKKPQHFASIDGVFQVHGIYLISEGDSSDSAREMLRDGIVKTQTASNTPIPLHVVSLFCHNNDTQAFLRSLAEAANGR